MFYTHFGWTNNFVNFLPQKCLDTSTCDCFTNLVLVDKSKSCTKFQDLDRKTRSAWNGCVDPDVDGSFADCRKQERLVVKYGFKCKDYPGLVTSRVGQYLLWIINSFNIHTLCRHLVAGSSTLLISRGMLGGGRGGRAYGNYKLVISRI